MVRPKNLSGLAASMAMGSSALRLVTSNALRTSSGEALGGTLTPSVAVTLTYSTRRDTWQGHPHQHTHMLASYGSLLHTLQRRGPVE